MPKQNNDQRINELHAEALRSFAKMEKIIDELKSHGPHSLDGWNALVNIQDWLGQLSGRAEISASTFRYERQRK